MNLTIETRALGAALLASMLSLGSAWLLASSIKMMGDSSSLPTTTTFSDINASPELISKGRELFGESCSHCHGDDAHGDEGPDLHNLSISNARMAATIKKGIKGEMPTFAKKYDDHQIAALVIYLRSLR